MKKLEETMETVDLNNWDDYSYQEKDQQTGKLKKEQNSNKQTSSGGNRSPKSSSR